MRNLEEFNQKHSNQCCFILGSGTSLLSHDLSILKNHITITVNSSYIAVKDATYFLSDDHDVAYWSYFSNDLKLSDTTVLLYENKLKHTSEIFGDRSVLFRHRKGYHITNTYEHNNSLNHICQARTSLGSAIHVAHIMGCDPIIILGLDCCRGKNGERWFWQMLPKSQHPYRTDGKVIDRYKKTRRKNEVSDLDLLDILNYWNTLTSDMVKKCHIVNVSPISKVQVFERMPLEKVLREYNIS